MTDQAITITGIRETQKALYSYSQQLGDRVVRGALRQGANYVLRGIKELIPVKTGLLKRRGFRVANSRIHNGRMSSSMIGVYIGMRKKKGDPFYGRFQNDGWNTHGKSAGGKRAAIRAAFGSRTGRKTMPGKTNVPGKKFVQRGFEFRKEAAVQLIVRAAEVGAEIVKRKVGLR